MVSVTSAGRAGSAASRGSCRSSSVPVVAPSVARSANAVRTRGDGQVDTALPHQVVPAPGPRFVHDALFCSSPDEMAAATVPFVEEGLAAGDAVVVIASPATADVVRTAVDDDRVRVLAWTEA